MKTQNRIIFLIYLILISLPYLTPIVFPLKISDQTVAFNNVLNSAPPEGKVFWNTEGNFQMWPDFGGGEVAVYKVLFTQAKEKGIKLVFAQFTIESATIAEGIINDLKALGFVDGLVYGVNYVNFGFIPGQEAAMAAFGADIKRTCLADAYGTPVGELPIMANINTMSDFAFAGFGGFGFEPQVRQWGQYKIPLITNQTSTLLANIVSWYQKGLLAGYLAGQNGSAEFERVSGYFGLGTSASAGQLFAHVYAIVLLIIPNIYFILKGKTGA